jgi:hypothetical protein
MAVLPFKASDTGPVVCLSNGSSKYETGFWLVVSNVARRESPMATVIHASPLVTAKTDTTSLAP